MAEAARRGEETMEDLLQSIRRILSEEEAAAPEGPPGEARPPASEPKRPPSSARAQALPTLVERSIREALLAAPAEAAAALPAPTDPPRPDQNTARPAPRREPACPERKAMDQTIIRMDAAQAGRDGEKDAPRANGHREDSPRANGHREAAPRAPSGTGEEAMMSERARASVGQSFDQLHRTLIAQDPRTLDDLVREMLRPMLKEWLDAHLPETVERLVRQEIERVTVKGR